MSKEEFMELIGVHSQIPDIDQLDECCYVEDNKLNSEYAKSISYGGYGSEEEFWENI